jgi:hypothetical protein
MKAVLLLIGFVLASIHVADAQQAGKIPRVGFHKIWSANTESALFEAFRALRESRSRMGRPVIKIVKDVPGVTQ